MFEKARFSYAVKQTSHGAINTASEDASLIRAVALAIYKKGGSVAAAAGLVDHPCGSGVLAAGARLLLGGRGAVITSQRHPEVCFCLLLRYQSGSVVLAIWASLVRFL